MKPMLICEAVTGHWIDDDWNLHEALLDFRQIRGRHSGEHLGWELFQILEHFDISDKLFCITSDSAENCGTLCTELTNILRDEKDIQWNHKERYIRCMNHVINLTIQNFIKSIKGLASNDIDERDFDNGDDDEDSDISLSEGFALAMWKIREFMKV